MVDEAADPCLLLVGQSLVYFLVYYLVHFAELLLSLACLCENFHCLPTYWFQVCWLTDPSWTDL